MNDNSDHKSNFADRPINRIALFLPGLYEGGAERAVLNLAGGLVARGCAIDLVLARAEGPYMDQIPAGVRVVELQRRPIKSFITFRSLPALVRYLRSERPVALLSALNANYVALCARRFCGMPQRLVLSEQNTFSFFWGQVPVWHRAVMYWLTRRLYPWADHIVAVSEGAADDLAKTMRVPRERIEVIYNPVITPELKAKKEEIVKHPWFEPGSPPVVLAVGRLTSQKDFNTLIQAFARVRKSRLAHLLILGEGEERTDLETLVKRVGLEREVELHGFVPNPYAYMAKAAVFVLSSKYEGLPTVLIEALYCGASIVTTDCPSGPREILKDRRHGRLVPVGDVASLAEAIDAALADKSTEPNPESWQPFALDTVVNQFAGILNVTPQCKS